MGGINVGRIGEVPPEVYSKSHLVHLVANLYLIDLIDFWIGLHKLNFESNSEILESERHSNDYKFSYCSYFQKAFELSTEHVKYGFTNV